MKKDFFDSKFFKILEIVGKLITLNIVFVITCIPLITIGASITALYSAMGAEMSVSSFFTAYKKNWKQSTVVWLILIVLIDLVFLNGFLVMRNEANPPILYIIALILSIFLTGLLFSWAFQLIALFDNTTKNILKNSVLLGFANLPISLVVIILNLIFPVELVFCTTKFLQFGWIWIGFGFSLIAFLCTKLLRCAITNSTGILFEKEEPSYEDLGSEND